MDEIERWAGASGFRAGHPAEPHRPSPRPAQATGKIFEAAAANDLPVGIHAFGFGGHPVTASGWPSYYIEDMVGHAQSAQSFLTSMVIEGVFERLPDLKVICIETGFGWLPSLGWRLDKTWKTLKQETPHLKMAPSEYMRRQHLGDDAADGGAGSTREHVLDTIEWIGWDRVLYSTDYPHWDFDDPAQAIPLKISEENRQKLFLTNALQLYKQTV